MFKSRQCVDPLPFNGTLDRFDARYWSIDYPLTAIGTIVADTKERLDVYTEHRSNRDLVGLIWSSQDLFGHESFEYENNTSYTGTKLAFQANLPSPFDSTVTINRQDVVRMFPYEKQGSNLVPVPNPKFPTNPPKTYDYATVTGNPASPTSDYWYVIDFDDLILGYNREGAKVPSEGITNIFISIVSQGYNMGANATMVSVGGGIDPHDIDWLHFADTIPNLELSKGDIIDFSMGIPEVGGGGKVPSIKYRPEPGAIQVDVWERVSPTEVRVKFPATQYGVAFAGGPAVARKLRRDTAIGNQAVNFHLANIHTTGHATIHRRNYPDPAHSLHMTSGFDDTYNITPYRQVEQAYALGYRGRWTTYMGMSHYFKAHSTPGQPFKIDLDKTAVEPLNHPTVKHCEDLFKRMHDKGYTFVWSTAYEILNSVMPDEWKQINALGEPALTGWVPPSSFIQPSRVECLDYLAHVIQNGLKILTAQGHTELFFQIGEPWWWDGLYSDGYPCIYDPYTMALYKTETGLDVPTPFITNSIIDIDSPAYVKHKPYVQWLQTKLGDSTNHIKNTVKQAYPNAKATLLFFTPQIMNPASTFLTLLNFPEARWTYPEYDFMQIEDYDWLIEGKLDLNYLTFEAAINRLKYPADVVEYFVGFVNYPTQRWVWPNMEWAVGNARAHGIQQVAVWAYPQVIRDDIMWYEESHVQPPHYVQPPRRTLAGVDNLLIEPRIFVKVGTDKRMHSGIGDRTLNGETYHGMGRLGKISPLNENLSFDEGGLDLSLIGIPVGFYNSFIERWNGEDVEMWLSVVPAEPPVLIYVGVVESHTVKPNAGGDLEFKMRVKNKVSDLGRSDDSRYTHNNQLILHPGDMGLEFVADLKNLKLNWGQ